MLLSARFRKLLLRPVTLLVCSTGCASAVSGDRAASACSPASEASVAPRLEYLRTLASDSDSVYVVGRKAFELERVLARKVAWITTPSVCAAAVAAVNQLTGTPGRVRQVWVYSLGQAYAVEDPSLGWTEPTGSPYPIYLFDRNWRSKPVLML
jgi:hypothetical protein